MTTTPAVSSLRTVVPPGPRQPVEMATIREDPLGFLRSMFARYGDVTRHFTSGEEVVVINDPELAHQVLRGHPHYTKLGTPDESMLTPLLGKGLLTSEGEVWVRQRHLCQPAFRRREVERLDTLMTETAAELADHWEMAAEAGEVVRVDHDLTALTLQVVVQALLGSDLSAIGARFGEAVDVLNRFMGHYEPGTDEAAGTTQAKAGFAAAKSFLDRVVQVIVAGRRATPVVSGRAPDLLDALLAARGPGGELTDSELRDQVITILMAGHETTAKALTWTAYLVDRHPGVAERLNTELDRVLGGRVPTAADLPALVYTRMVIDEALRLYPPVWQISRRAATDSILGRYRVSAGSLVCVSPYILHRHPRYWDSPEEFRPERFAAGEEASAAGRAYLPFGGGPRICVGQAFALSEAQLVLATLASRIRLRAVSDETAEPEALVTLRPRNGLRMRPVVVRRG